LHSRAALGKWGEEQACQYWQSIGGQILARNWRCRHGEIDILLIDHEELVACEVKTRQSHLAGTPFESVTPEKFRRLVVSFGIWRREHSDVAHGRLWRIDAIGVSAWPARLDIDHRRRLGF